MNYSILMLVAALAAYGLTGLAPFSSDQPSPVEAFEDPPEGGAGAEDDQPDV